MHVANHPQTAENNETKVPNVECAFTILKRDLILAWRYILTDFYKIHYDNVEFNSDHVIRRMIERFTMLCKAALHATWAQQHGRLQASHKADMGRQPEKRIDINEFRPISIFETTNDNELVPSRKLIVLLERLKLEHIVRHKDDTRRSRTEHGATKDSSKTRGTKGPQTSNPLGEAESRAPTTGWTPPEATDSPHKRPAPPLSLPPTPTRGPK